MKSLFGENYMTGRLFLETLGEKDAEFIFQLTNSSGWLKFIGNRNIKDTSTAVSYIQKIEAMPEAKYWKVVENKSKKSIGVITLIKRDYLDDYDIGYAFLPESEGQGFAQEATAKILEQAIEKSSTGKIYAVTKRANFKSVKLLTKLGLKPFKTISPDSDEVELFMITSNQSKN